MTLRTTSSSCTFTAGAVAGTVVKSTITLTELKKLVTSPHSVRPVALTEGSGVATPSELKVTRVLIQSVDDPEMLVRVYQGDPIQIDAAMGAWARNVTRVGVLSNKSFNPEHGLEIEYTYENVGGAAYNSVTAWDVQNQEQSDVGMALGDILGVSGGAAGIGGVPSAGLISLAIANAFTSLGVQMGSAPGVLGGLTPPPGSDSRFKTGIEDSPVKKYAKIGLRDVTWLWNATAKKILGEVGRATGVIAQEVEKLYPFAVVKDDNGYRYVRYDLLNAMVSVA